MAGKTVDKVFVDVLPDLSGFDKEADKIKKPLSKIERDAAKAAEKIDREFERAAKKIERDFERAAKATEKSFERANKKILKDEQEFEKQLERNAEELRKLSEIDLDLEVSPTLDPDAAEKVTDDLDAKLKGSKAKVRKTGEDTGREFGDGVASGAKGALSGLSTVVQGALGAIGVAVTGQLASAVASIGAALVPAAGFLAAALPAAAATAAAGIGILTLAFSGLDDAISNLDNEKKFNEALEKLSPTARTLALTIRDLVPAFNSIKFALQDATFAGFDKELRATVTTLSGPLKSSLKGIGEEFNRAGKELFEFVRSAGFIENMKSFLLGLKASFDELTPAIKPFLTGLTDALVAVQPLVVNLSGGIGQAAKEFGTFLSKAAASGDLQKFFQDGLAILGDLGSILKNVGSILGSLFNASSTKGETFLTTIKEITGEFAAFLKSAGGASALTALFDTFRTLSDAVLDIVKPLLPLVSQMIQLLGPEISAVLKSLSAVLQPVVKAFVDAFLPIFPDLIKTAKQVAPIVQQLATTFGAELGKALGQLLPLFAELLLQLLPIAVPLIRTVAEVMGFLSPAIQIVFLPLKNLVTGVILLIEGIKALIKWLGDIDWSGIGKAIGKFFTDAWNKVTTFFEGVGKFFSELPGKIGDFLSSLPGKFVGLLNAAFDAAIKAIGIGIGLVLSFFIETPRLVVEAVSSLPEKLGKFWDSLWSDIKTKTTTGFNAVLEFLSGIPDKVLTAIGTVRAKVGQLFTDSLAFWRNIISTGFDSVVEFIKSIPNKLVALGGFFRYAGERIINGFIDGIKNVGNFIGDVAGSIVRTITGFLNRVIRKVNEGIAEVDELLPGSLPRIPEIALASGALVTGPTSALVGEAGDEFVLPLQGSRARRAAEALGISGGDGQTVNFENGAIQISFEGVVPTDQQAIRTGEAVAQGINQTLARRNIRTQVRMA